jgi:hypothetical protein
MHASLDGSIHQGDPSISVIEHQAAQGRARREVAMAAEYYFDDGAVNRALEAARQPYEGRDLRAVSEIDLTQPPQLRIRAQCISVVSEDHKVCLTLPFKLGRVCLPLPFDLPDGTAARACISICTFLGVPSGACVRVTVGGEEVVEQCFGFSC